MRILIVFFSRADENYNVGIVEKGNTEILAEYISELTGGTLFKIERETPYPKSYNDCIKEAKKELEEYARPKLKSRLTDLDEYDLIFLGYPNWWGDVPMCIYSFLDDYILEGKKIIPFCTHEGSGFGQTINNLKNHYPDANFIGGLAIQGSKVKSAKPSVEKWLKGEK